MLLLVLAQKDTSRMKMVLVLLVLQNVKLVLITNITVLSVTMKELLNQACVHVMMVNMNPMTIVTIVHTNVPPVLPSTIVSLVPTIPEDQSKTVTVKMVTITKTKMLYVQLVKSNVPLVPIILITVLFVLLPESKVLNHIVIVKIINSLMLTDNVLTVTTNVLLVKDLLITVLLVLISEDQPTLVHVQLVIMKLTKSKPVTLVTQDVPNVKTLEKTVLFVLMIELLLQKLAHVTQVKPKSMNNVKSVTGNVKPVFLLLPTV